MGTLRCVGMRVSQQLYDIKARGVGGPTSGERVCAGGAEFPSASAASTAEEHLGPVHLDRTADSSWQARHTRRLWACS